MTGTQQGLGESFSSHGAAREGAAGPAQQEAADRGHLWHRPRRAASWRAERGAGGWGGGRGLQPHTQEPKQRSCDITGEPASLAGTAQSGDQEVQVPLPLALVSSGTWLGLTKPSMSSAGKPQRDIGNPESTSVFSWGSNETKFLKAQPHSLPPASTNSKVATGQLSR